MTSVRIRAASERDLANISALLSATWHATYDQWYGRQKVTDISAQWHAPRMLARLLHQAGSVMLVAEEGFELIGVTRGVIIGQTHVDLSMLYVLPRAQGQGLGLDLFNAICARLPQALPIRLEVEPRNEGAIRFYTRQGFRRVGEVMNCGGGLSGIKADVYERAPPAPVRH
jgi:ribosomal protein S18 acetylase RimI-like enzyme